MSANDGGYAFPLADAPLNGNGDQIPPLQPGMSLRDYFAAKADVSVYSPFATFQNKHDRAPTVDELAAYIASIRFAEADAMLRARAPKDQP